MLPTNHGFDEFYGNLYHLNAEEEPKDKVCAAIPTSAARLTSNTYYDWLLNAYLLVPAADVASPH